MPADPAERAALVRAREALARGDPAMAARLAEAVARRNPAAAEARFLLGMALVETGHAGHALGQIEQAARLEPGQAEYAVQRARVLSQLQRDADARAAAHAAMALPVDDPLVLDTLGCVLARLGDHDRALPLFARAVAAVSDSLSFRFNYASSLGFFGKVAEAEAQYEAMIARDPAHGAAWYGLVMLRRQTPEANRALQIEAAIPHARDHDSRVRLHYAAAKTHEDLGNSAAAFAHLDTANRAHRAMIGYDPAVDAALFDALEAAFAAPPPRGDAPGRDGPIFVVGLPRTGTTLVERILAAHPDTLALGELQAMPLAIKRLAGTQSRLVLDPETIAAAAAVPGTAIAEAYRAQAMAQAGAEAGAAAGKRLIDKFPLNFLYIGHILRAFPRARVVCLRRQPMDSVWSNYKHLFALGSPYYGYSHDLMDTARYFARFDRLMAHWQARHGDAVLQLEYEALLTRQEPETRRLLAHCGLDWNPACLTFNQTTDAVATPSAQQVRRPLNRDAVARWRAYAAEMAGVAAFFEESGIAVEQAA